MHIAAICCTYKRPTELMNAVACFLAQDYPHKTLVIVDDAGQYWDSQLPNVKMLSITERYSTLGEKRNASARLAGDVDAFAVWDDDDGYATYHLSSLVQLLESADVVRPRAVITRDQRGNTKIKNAGGLFHGAWAFRHEAFYRVGQYPAMQSGQDQGLLRRFKQHNVSFATNERITYVYNWFARKGAYHISAMGPGGYERLSTRKISGRVTIEPKLELNWDEVIKKCCEKR